MKITLHDVSKGRGGQALPSTSLEFHTGAVRFALAETEQRPTVLGLIASGRMRPETGRVTIDGTTDNRMLRRTIALVDAPDVSDPHPDIALAGVVGEELMFAGLGATPIHARRWLNQLGYGELAGAPIGTVDPAVRVRILCELAVLREGTRGIVLVSPDRHGGSPDGWWRIAMEFADRGYAMLVIVGGSAAVALERMHEFDAVNASGPVEPLVPSTEESARFDSPAARSTTEEEPAAPPTTGEEDDDAPARSLSEDDEVDRDERRPPTHDTEAPASELEEGSTRFDSPAARSTTGAEPATRSPTGEEPAARPTTEEDHDTDEEDAR